MIIPLVSEPEWLEALSKPSLLPLWTERTFVISPHPDDETLGAGGLIHLLCERHVPVTVVAVTDGERAYSNHADGSLGDLREQEQADALEVLGVSRRNILRLRLPDSRLHESETMLEKRLSEAVTPGARLVAPWLGDFHPDHETCGRVARRIADRLQIPLVSYLFWTWHRGRPDDLPFSRLARVELPHKALESRAKALRCHASQLSRASGDPILPQDLLRPMERSFEVYLT